MKPNNFPWIPGLTLETEIYTQRRHTSEAPANYKFTLQTLLNWIKVMLGLTLVLEFEDETVWACHHNMGRFPLIKCVDADGNTLYGSESYVDQNNYTITFSSPRTGKVYLR